MSFQFMKQIRSERASMHQPSARSIQGIKVLFFAACVLPLGLLMVYAAAGGLGADPVEAISHMTGLWSLRLLLLTLAVTPLRLLTDWQWLTATRRIIGLFAFFYGLLHVLTYLVFDQFFDGTAILQDIAKRPHLAAGWLGFVLMLPLALTSCDAMVRRFGISNWRRLHRLAYFSAAAGVFHYFWLVKQDVTAPACYALVLAVLLSVRMAGRPGRRSKTAREGADAGFPAEQR